MSFYLSKIILHNRAPFDHLELDFTDNNITILNAVNGGGKTTILSHIVDAWHEMARLGFSNAFEGKTGKYYRVSSPIHSLDGRVCSLFYARFINDGKNIDYLDIRGKCDSQEYENIVKLENKIRYNEIQKELNMAGNVKKLSISLKKGIKDIFKNNVITYFPAYRYEEPGYLNEPFQVKTKFSLEQQYTGYLRNPLEVITGLPELANWIMDILLDTLMNQPKVDEIQNRKTAMPSSIIEPLSLYSLMNQIFSNALNIKFDSRLYFSIGNRDLGATRIQIAKTDSAGNSVIVYPSIFNMSSGENAIVTLFGEILRQFDNIQPNGLFFNATGIVLIDEIDKHLHVKLQKEILPNMFILFPNFQFIITSHSPFVSMGLCDRVATKQKTRVIDLDKNGIETEPSSTEVFREAYDTMFEKNKRYKRLYEELMNAQTKKYQLYVEDKYDQIYKIAWLKVNDIDFDEANLLTKFDENAPFQIFGGYASGGVQGLLNCANVTPYSEKCIIGLFDYDKEGSEKFLRLHENNIRLIYNKCPEGTLLEGFYKKRVDHQCMYALILPVPLKQQTLIHSNADWNSAARFDNYFEIESYLPKDYLATNNDFSNDSTISELFVLKDDKKDKFWKSLINEPKELFTDFQLLFNRINELFGLNDSNLQEIAP